MENNPFYRGREGEESGHEQLLLRNVWIPQFTEARELIQSTMKFLEPSQREGLYRNIRLDVSNDLKRLVTAALSLPNMPLNTDHIGMMSRLIEQKHQEVFAARYRAIVDSSIHSNARKLTEAFEPMSEASTQYFDHRPTSALREPVMDGLAAYYAASQAMSGLEQYLEDNLTSEDDDSTSESKARKILNRVNLAVAALDAVQNRSPLRFILRDIQQYRTAIIALNMQIDELVENEDYEIIIKSDEELQQVLLQLRSYLT